MQIDYTTEPRNVYDHAAQMIPVVMRALRNAVRTGKLTVSEGDCAIAILTHKFLNVPSADAMEKIVGECQQIVDLYSGDCNEHQS